MGTIFDDPVIVARMLRLAEKHPVPSGQFSQASFL
jgi:hypothetical protein